MSTTSNKPRIIVERALAIQYLLVDGWLLINLVRLAPSQQFYIAFFFVRSLAVILAIVISIVRRSPRFYIPGLREMSAPTYWRFVCLILLTIKIPVLQYFVSLSPFFQLVDLAVLSCIIVSFLIAYQTQPWTLGERAKRQQRIKYLTKKASLSDEEVKTLWPILIVEGKKRQRKPVIWRLTELLVGVIMGAIINAYASVLADSLEQLGIHMPNILPPF
jgi:hypothetical protein